MIMEEFVQQIVVMIYVKHVQVLHQHNAKVAMTFTLELYLGVVVFVLMVTSKMRDNCIVNLAIINA